MEITRRTVLGGGVAAATGLMLPRLSVAEIAVGGGSVTTVSDGNLVLPAGFIGAGLPQEEYRAILAEFGVDPERMEPPCNLAVYRDGTRTVLFDAGSGSGFMPSAGALTESLDVIGIAPEDVTHVVITHGHPDHIWGLLDDFDDPMFPNAAHFMGRIEWEYWMAPETVETIGAARQSFAAGALRRLEALGDQITQVEAGDDVLSGVEAVASFGHTPGHLSFEIGGDDGVFVIGDAVGNHHVSFVRPEWEVGSDQDPALGAETRVALLDRLAARAGPVVGFHLPGGGIGRVERAGDGYRFISDG